MNPFFRTFFASLLAFFVFWILAFFFFVAVVASLASGEKPLIVNRSVLRIDLGRHFSETERRNPLNRLSGGEADAPGLYDAVRLIREAAADKHIDAILLEAEDNGNGYAASEELRQALVHFRSKGKYVVAYGNRMSQKAYYVATAAERIYLGPAGMLEWKGLAVELTFFKNTLDRLGIQPQIFYAGKFKSATEPFRTDRMTPENRLQTTEWLGDLYRVLLQRVSAARGIDTVTLHRLANEGRVQNAGDALREGLVDGLRYDDEIRSELKKRIGAASDAKLHIVDLDTYAEAASYKQTGSSRIGLLYAEGNIVDGDGGTGSIGDKEYVKMIRKMRLDKSIKAIVFRINSGGGSALASENIWRELSLARKEKPLVVSFGDVAASGGYYIATPADSIFALPNTITGSIGVFTVIPNLKGFFNDKLGVTFDGVKTAEHADQLNIYRPMNSAEQGFQQREVERIYALFKQRVADGRRKDTAYIGSIAQGRVWSGIQGQKIGLVDRIGSLEEAVRCAARMAKVDSYRLREFPEREGWLNDLLNRKKEEPAAQLERELGTEQFAVYQQLVGIRQMCNTPQMRMPFQFMIR
ncbi:signal peptide peptidase SppA [Flaviaesturariibacter flavus]|uniref:Signal peptide peptidase SppA n=1 Tax=Flaviaesturariibacter flavus TaxID=2502780 RepID=A0A4R1B336_9BACT|nr:signal peptide peptidase SppA [Flaviaesturariibacter flavus]TCJ12454.1 signal peptide peptidase SppA [Flaviaesturariibacter flavus]